MREYAATDACRMVYLRELLDDHGSEPCGRCDRCRGTPLDATVPAGLVGDATVYLRSAYLVIEPRKQWIWGQSRPRIAADERAESGRALSIEGDGGWGAAVGRCRRLAVPGPDELVAAAVRLLEGWQPAPAPEWLTTVPSTSTGPLIEDFAGRLADALGLPLVPVLRRRHPARPQAEMANSVQQLHNVAGAFEVVGPVPSGAVLLVDDLVQSGWTLTVCAAELRRAGAKAVHPFVLAKAGGG
jgi:ATP-dependent DNA helicase RecQ